jgi:hypothetical protein
MRIPGLSFNDLPPSLYHSPQLVVQDYPSFFALKGHQYAVLITDTSTLEGNLLIHSYSLWEDSLILPPIFATLSLLVLTVHYISTLNIVKRAWAHFTKSPVEEQSTEPNVVTDANGFFAELRHHTDSLGGLGIFIFRVLRLLSVFALVALSAVTFVADEEPSTNTIRKGKHWGKKHRHRRGGSSLSFEEWLDLGVSIAYVSSQHTPVSKRLLNPTGLHCCPLYHRCLRPAKESQYCQ